ncbi:BOS complex subunit NOMO1-like isoform X2 [Halichondria panicea]|uniref:BOS complex subunit NOMO1-like isoform X2 n=1 Tax=Halichondria panicea TaxID=6063 RepID=UPI00312B8C05
MSRSFWFAVLLLVLGVSLASGGEGVPVGCGGFIKADFPVDFTKIKIQLYTASGSLRDTSDCAPNIGYYLIPSYDKGEFVLKVDAPQGWKTEPSEVHVTVDGETDLCSRGEDINFQLLGFSVFGQVVGDGLKVGPSGVTLSLRQDDSTPHTTVTADEGRFVLEGVPPGTYTLEASHQQWTLSKATVSVTVTDGSSEVPDNSLLVGGFDVRGGVASDGEPIPGVQFLLYAKSGKKIECDAGDPPVSVRRPTCVAVSDVTGLFVFPALPPGRYQLVPYYSQNGIDFKVHPTETEVEVFNDTVNVDPSFEVHGFSVSGQVLRTTKGKGVSGAKVYVDGEEVTTTDHRGNYQLLNVTTGRYNIKIDAPEALLEFKELQVYLSPSDPTIPTIIPAKFGVCGEVIITRPVSTAKTPRTVQVLSTSSPPVVVETVTVDAKSQFCTLLPLGEYIIKSVVSEEERSGGLVIEPPERRLDMREHPPSPASTLVFQQFLASLTGSVTCLGKCTSDISVHLRRSSVVTGLQGQELNAKVAAKERKGTFSFSEVLPGNVNISVSYPQWCWREAGLQAEVTMEKQREMNFKQTGYSMQYTVSHDTTVTYSTGNESAVEIVLSGKGHLCLDKSGVYTVSPRTCHKFNKDSFTFDTSLPERLVLEAKDHYVNASVMAEQKDSDLLLTVRSLRFGSSEQVLTPLGVARQPTAENQAHNWKYSFSFLAKPQDELEVSPSSTQLMFSPHSRVFTTSNDCPEEVASFLGSPGLMVTGRVEPALGGVVITIATEEDGLVSTNTDEQGRYRVGPLRGGKGLTVSAEKDGYTFEVLPNDPHSFAAVKLSNIVIKVVSSDGGPLSNVLVSLSGANFRSNNFTGEDGTLNFPKLNPGQYFIKTLLREYEFQPSSKVVDLVQGGSEEIVFAATRVAFSCSGRVTTLNKQPLEGVVVKAFGTGDGECESYGMETPTDQNGDYRLRGLMPGCSYTVSIEVSGDIDRSLPVNRRITVSDSDVEGVEFVAMPTTMHVYITGNVVADNKHFPMLKAQLSQGAGSVLTSVLVDTAGFFDFPPITTQKEDYVVTLESTFSSYSYNLTRPEMVVPGNRDSHVTLSFSADELLSIPDYQRGSVIALIVTVAVIFAIFNLDKVFGLVQTLLSNVRNSQRDSVSSENRKKTGRRR